MSLSFSSLMLVLLLALKVTSESRQSGTGVIMQSRMNKSRYKGADHGDVGTTF